MAVFGVRRFVGPAAIERQKVRIDGLNVIDLACPNAYDRIHGKAGSALIVPVAWASIGCLATPDGGI
jgi:hypothetical protein